MMVHQGRKANNCSGSCRLIALVGVIGLTLAASAAPASASYGPAAAAVRVRVEEQFPRAHSIFVNCPGKNTVAAGISCEFRFVIHGKVRTGGAIAEPSPRTSRTATWSSPGLVVNPGGRRHRLRCSLYGTRGLSNPEPLSLTARGTSCDLAAAAARAMSNYVATHALRLPRSFTYTFPEPESLGFVVKRYACRGSVEVRRTSPASNQPEVGFELARCHNRFGDRFRYAFIQGA